MKMTIPIMPVKANMQSIDAQIELIYIDSRRPRTAWPASRKSDDLL